MFLFHRRTASGASAQRRSGPGWGDPGRAGQPPKDDPENRKPKWLQKINKTTKNDSLITSDYMRNANFVARKILRCKVKKFERGNDLQIKRKLLQIETYYIIS